MNDDPQNRHRDYWRDDTWTRPQARNLGRFTTIPPKVGEGGPGTVYTATGFEEATGRHGRPHGVFEKDRQLTYRG